jgi:hypothetical protein
VIGKFGRKRVQKPCRRQGRRAWTGYLSSRRISGATPDAAISNAIRAVVTWRKNGCHVAKRMKPIRGCDRTPGENPLQGMPRSGGHPNHASLCPLPILLGSAVPASPCAALCDRHIPALTGFKAGRDPDAGACDEDGRRIGEARQVQRGALFDESLRRRRAYASRGSVCGGGHCAA